MSEKYYDEFGPLMKTILAAHGYQETPYTGGGLGKARDFKKGEITISLLYDLRDDEVCLQRHVAGKRTHQLFGNQYKQFQASLESWLEQE